MLFCSTALATGPLTITPSGYYLTVVDSDGKPNYVKIETVIDLTNNPDPTPEEPKVNVELVKRTKAWAEEVGDPSSAQAIAAVYAHIRGALTDGVLTPDTVWNPLKQATDSALGVIQDGKDWSKFRSSLTEVFTIAQQKGQLSTTEQIALILLSVQQGVELSADGSVALTMDQMVEITRRTNLAIDGATK